MIRLCLKALIASLFIILGMVSFLNGDRMGALERDRPPFVFAGFLSPDDELRKQIANTLLEDGSLEYGDAFRRLTRRAQVDVLPYEVALANSVAASNPAAARRFAELAIERQPRSVAARLHLLSASAQEGDLDALVREYDGLLRLGVLDSETLSDAIVGVFRTSDNWAVLLDYLKTQPEHGAKLAKKLLAEKVTAADLDSVLLHYPHLQRDYLSDLVKSGNYERAYTGWKLFVGITDDDPLDVPHNGAFATLDDPPPFNWALHRQWSELQDEGGLHVTYRGTGEPLFVSQILHTPPGRYALRTEVKGIMYEGGGSLVWGMKCISNQENIARSEIQLETIQSWETFEIELEIPDRNCLFQRLELKGRAGDFPEVSRTVFRSVKLTPLSY